MWGDRYITTPFAEPAAHCFNGAFRQFVPAIKSLFKNFRVRFGGLPLVPLARNIECNVIAWKLFEIAINTEQLWPPG